MSSPTPAPGLPPESPRTDLPDAAMTVAGVARRLGVAAATLRTWDRRYGLGPSSHAAGSHRRYDAADVARLEVMRRLVMEGSAPADAARAALAASPPAASTTQPGATTETVDRASTSSPRRIDGDSRAGGGQVIPVPGVTRATRGLARAAMGLDAPAVSNIVSTHLDEAGVIQTWDQLVLPVLEGVGRRYAATGLGIEVEHLLSAAVISAFDEVTRRLTRPHNHQPVLLAAAEEEQHTLPLHAVAAALAERHVATRMLGARVPREALAAAIRRSGPIAVLLWAQTPGDDRGEELSTLPSIRPAPLVLVGGRGWSEDLPPSVSLTHDLDDAVARLIGATLA